MNVKNALDYSGKTILVCGASDGIGYGVASMYKELGATVHITGTRTADAYENDFSGLEFHSLNLQSAEDITAFARNLISWMHWLTA